jgi:uncharacterized protein
MNKEFVVSRLDVRSFAQAGAELAGQIPLQEFSRLAGESSAHEGPRLVDWHARGDLRTAAGGADQIWLQLTASVSLPMTCQRCLTPVDIELSVDRPFRFVPDEEAAAAQDEEAEEDVLELSPAFDLALLIEDELLMALPVVPRHETCPVEVKLTVADKEFEAEMAAKPNPFAALSRLKG